MMIVKKMVLLILSTLLLGSCSTREDMRQAPGFVSLEILDEESPDLDKGKNSYFRKENLIAIHHLRPLMKEGNKEAKYYLALTYLNWREKKWSELKELGEKYLIELAEEGHLSSIEALEKFYKYDVEKARYWSEKSVSQGSMKSRIFLASILTESEQERKKDILFEVLESSPISNNEQEIVDFKYRKNTARNMLSKLVKESLFTNYHYASFDFNSCLEILDRMGEVKESKNLQSLKDLKIFGVSINKDTTRSSLREGIKKAGAIAKQEIDDTLGDEYDISDLLPGSLTLSIFYTFEDKFAEALFSFPKGSFDVGLNILKNKYSRFNRESLYENPYRIEWPELDGRYVFVERENRGDVWIRIGHRENVNILKKQEVANNNLKVLRSKAL
jgi:hypothetical protein